MHYFIVHKAWRKALPLQAMHESGNMQRIPSLALVKIVPDRYHMVSGHSIRGELNCPWSPGDTFRVHSRRRWARFALDILPCRTCRCSRGDDICTWYLELSGLLIYRDIQIDIETMILTEATETMLSCLFFCPSHCILFLDLFRWFRCFLTFDESPDATSGSTLDRGIHSGRW